MLDLNLALVLLWRKFHFAQRNISRRNFCFSKFHQAEKNRSNHAKLGEILRRCRKLIDNSKRKQYFIADTGIFLEFCHFNQRKKNLKICVNFNFFSSRFTKGFSKFIIWNSSFIIVQIMLNSALHCRLSQFLHMCEPRWKILV